MVLAGCKPTESNYREAYDAAMQKKKASAREDVLPAGVKLQKVGAPAERKVDGENVKVINMRIKVADVKDTSVAPGRYNVAVAKYKLPTNAKAQTIDLRRDGVAGAFVARGADGAFYVIASVFPDINQAADFAKKYGESHPQETIVGLEDGIVIIEN